MLFLSPVVQAGWEREATLEDFEKTGDLGSGAFGKVGRYKHKKSGIVYALKQMNKAKLKATEMVDQIKTEIKIMYSLQHDHIIKLYNHFEDDEHIYLVIEYASGGQLWQKLHTMEGKRFPEKMVAQYIKDLATVLEFLHGRGIIHRDIKPENILLDKSGRVKLADFGWSNFLKPDVVRTTFCGTLDYLPPEMLTSTHAHDQMVDIWSLGILTYELLTGRAPFMPTSVDLSKANPKDIERQTQENIANVKYDFPKDFPPLAKDLVSRILKRNPKTRIGLQEIKTHPWIKLNAQSSKLTKGESTEKAIENINFGKNMADKMKIQTKGEGFEAAFTEDEIMDIARPDSLLEKENVPEFGNPLSKMDAKAENFKKNMGGGAGKTESEMKKFEDDPRIGNETKVTIDPAKIKMLEGDNAVLKKEIDQAYTVLSDKDILLNDIKRKFKDMEDKYKKLCEKAKDKGITNEDADKLKESNQLLEDYVLDIMQAHKDEMSYLNKKVLQLESQVAGEKVFDANVDLTEQNKRLTLQADLLEKTIKSRFG
eukprot:CAMPEP_0176431400 /NCGR_PEP_ID=MMETSP0127-20121128/14795_1 /TAXON_ID=938130 /ORGANISM="Platyophrya macrostoma, Strain WH" /LENGTH=538 /DNA_ID=CAMNT_0017813411 /DNA_START=70 /DNA_END=1686 /DNA_ORIENTATION=-